MKKNLLLHVITICLNVCPVQWTEQPDDVISDFSLPHSAAQMNGSDWNNPAKIIASVVRLWQVSERFSPQPESSAASLKTNRNGRRGRKVPPCWIPLASDPSRCLRNELRFTEVVIHHFWWVEKYALHSTSEFYFWQRECGSPQRFCAAAWSCDTGR